MYNQNPIGFSQDRSRARSFSDDLAIALFPDQTPVTSKDSFDDWLAEHTSDHTNNQTRVPRASYKNAFLTSSAETPVDAEKLAQEKKARCKAAIKDAQYRKVMSPGGPGLDLYNGWKAGRLEHYTNPDCWPEDGSSVAQRLSEAQAERPDYSFYENSGRGASTSPLKLTTDTPHWPEALSLTEHEELCRINRDKEKLLCELAVEDAQYRGVMADGAAGLDLYNGWKAGQYEKRYNEDCDYDKHYEECLSKYAEKWY